MVNKILLAGYYGYDNGGDELILYSLLKDLRRLKEKIEISVLSGNPEKTGKCYGVKTISRWNLFAVAIAIFHADLLVFGGGGLLQDITSSWSIYYYLALILVAKLFLKKVLLISQGIGPIRKRISRKVSGIVLGLVDLITVRDELSKFELEKLNRNVSVYMVPDPSFNLDAQAFTPGPGKHSNFKKQPTIGICLRGLKEDEKFRRAVRDICAELVREIGSEIILIPFHKLEDLEISKQIVRDRRADYQLFLWEDIEELLDVYNEIDLVLGMRLHSIILASIFRKPFMALSLPKNHPLYDPKLENFLQLLNSKVIDTETPASEIVNKVGEIWTGRQKFLQAINPTIIKLKENSRKNMYLMQRFLKFPLSTLYY